MIPKIRYTVLLLTFTLLCSCASVPMGDETADMEAKKFQVPAKTSRIYVYRNETFGSLMKVGLTLDGRVMGETAPHVYFAWDVKPGRDIITCSAQSNSE